MALICMAVWDTEENNRSGYTDKTLASLFTTVQDLDNRSKHRLVVIDNNSCEETHQIYREWRNRMSFEVIQLTENIGQARALNRGIQCRRPDEFVVRMDNDIIIHQRDWIEDMEYAVDHDPLIAIVGLKRRDAWECPTHENHWWRSELQLLPHQTDERWMVIEVADSIMGTCQGLNPKFLDKVGYFYQPGLYGLEDALMATRAHVIGMKTCFLPHIVVDHIGGNDGDTSYGKWKRDHVSPLFQEFEAEKKRINLIGDVYHGPD